MNTLAVTAGTILTIAFWWLFASFILIAVWHAFCTNENDP